MESARVLYTIVGWLFVGTLVQAREFDERSDIQPPQIPNVLLIVADDLGIHDLHCYGRSDHNTPNLDKLASQGIRYSSAYCGLSICSASRASLMTGKSSARLHLTTFLPGRPDAISQLLLHPQIQPNLPSGEKTIAEVLRDVGYRTGLFGKWHLGTESSAPTKQGFDVAFEPKGNGAIDEREGGKSEYAITDAAIAFLKSEDNAPSFCYIPHHSPHVALSAPQDLIDKNASAFNPLYAATIESLDQSIGKLMAVVDQLKRPTIVIFTSDNGGLHVPEVHDLPATHNGPYRAGKGFLYEGGLRVPLIVRWNDKIRAAQVLDEPVSLMDLMPTLMEVIGIDPAKTVGPLDGVSQKSSWLSSPQTGLAKERSFYWHFPLYTNQGSRPAAAVRSGKWKLVESLEDGSIELFDLDKDPSEKANVASEVPDTAKALQESLHQWQRKMGAQIVQRNPNANSEIHRRLYIDSDPSRLDSSAGAVAVGAAWKPWRSEMNRVVAGRKTVLRDPNKDILLLASAGKTHGKNLRYEPEPYKNVIGYWTEVDDWVDWEVTIPADGTYEIEVQCGCGVKGGGSVAQLEIAGQSLQWTVRDTGHFQNMVYENIGQLQLQAGNYRLAVKPKSKAGVAIMDIRTIVLHPIAN